MSQRSAPAWIPSPRLEEAVICAMRAHASQARKGGTVPYLAHLFAVASLVMEDGGTETETIAALLHDTAEDQGGEKRLGDIEAQFGREVAEIVRGCSEPLTVPKPSWAERKSAYLGHLPTASRSVLRVALADKVHNARTMACDLERLRDKLWERFNAPRDDQARYYRDLQETFRSATPGSSLLTQLDDAVGKVFKD